MSASLKVEQNKRIAKNTIYLYFRSILIVLVNLYTSRILLTSLGVEDYGIYNVVAGFVSMFTFLNTALTNGTQRFLNIELGRNSIDGYLKVFRTSLSIQLIIVLCLLLLSETFGIWFLNNKMVIPDNRIEAANFIFQFSIITFIFNILQAPFSAIIISKERMGFYSIVGIVQSVLLLVIAFCVKLSPIDSLVFYGLLMLSVSVVLLLMNMFYACRIFPEIDIRPTFRSDRIKQMLSFSGWSLFGSFSTVIKSQGINVVLNMFFDVTINAARGIAYQVLAGVSSLIGNFQTAITPRLIQSYAERDYARYVSMVFKSSRISFILMWLIVLPIILSVNDVLGIWLGANNVPTYTPIFIKLVLLTGLIEVFASPIVQAISAIGDIKLFQICVSFIKLLVLPTSYILFTYGASPQTAMIVSLIMEMIAQCIRVAIWKTKFNISVKTYCFEVIFRAILISLSSYIICYAIVGYFSFKPLLQVMCVVIVTTIVISVITYFIGISNDERNRLISYLKRYARK